MDELRANSGFAQAELWNMTPRQMSAWLFVARKRLQKEQKAQLALHAIAVHDPKTVNKLLKAGE
jgi:hypothetical protein